MITLEYIGRKPIISEHGIGFETKEDKYEFIEPAAHILSMFLTIKEGYLTERLYPNKKLTTTDIFKIISSADANYEIFLLDQIHEYEKKLDDEIDEMDTKTYLSEEERATFKENLIYMKAYRLQRATNKIVYEWIINHCVKLIKSKHLDKIKVPFSMGFLHAVQSLQTTLELEKNAPEMALNVRADDITPYVELTIKI